MGIGQSETGITNKKVDQLERGDVILTGEGYAYVVLWREHLDRGEVWVEWRPYTGGDSVIVPAVSPMGHRQGHLYRRPFGYVRLYKRVDCLLDTEMDLIAGIEASKWYEGEDAKLRLSQAVVEAIEKQIPGSRIIELIERRTGHRISWTQLDELIDLGESAKTLLK